MTLDFDYKNSADFLSTHHHLKLEYSTDKVAQMMETVGSDQHQAGGGLWHRPDGGAPNHMGLQPEDMTSGPTADMFFHSAAAMDGNANHVNPASYYASPAAAARAVHTYRPPHGKSKLINNNNNNNNHKLMINWS